MRLPALIAILVTLAACATTSDQTQPYAEANSLMRQEIQARIANIPFQHRQEMFNNLLWLATKGGESAIPDLLVATRHKDSKVRSSAAWVLGRIRDRRVIGELTPLARDENESVRFEAARSLLLMGDMQYAPTLIEGLDSDKIPVRYNCNMALRDATARDFKFDHLEEDPAERRVAVLRWRQWWSEQSGDPWFAEQYAKQHGLGQQAGGADAKTGTPATPMSEVKVQQGPDQLQPGQAQPSQAQPGQAQPSQSQPGQAQPNQPQPSPSQPVLPQPRQQPSAQTNRAASTGVGETSEGGEGDNDPVKVEPWVQKVIEKVEPKDMPKPIQVPTPDPAGNGNGR
jgi:hypothetical protein